MTSLFRQAMEFGLSSFRVNLAYSLYTRYCPHHDDDDLFWLLVHVAEQAGNGHIRTSLTRITEEAAQWAGADEHLPVRLQERASGLVQSAMEKGLIAQLSEENARADSITPPRPPLLLTSDAGHIYFLRRRREEDAFLDMLGERSQTLSTIAPMEDKHPAETLCAQIKAGKRLFLLTGGPGTGKTATIAQVLNQLPTSLRVVLTAPTGRAAARMSESIPQYSGQTLHGLLGIAPNRPPKYNRNHPLTADLVIVDEASMVDLPLMNSLLHALAPHTALLLVGDPDQLPSVEAGALLGDLLHGARQAARSAKEGPLSKSVIQLTKVYRSNTAILEFAAAVRDGDMSRLNNAIDDDSVISIKPLRTVDAMASILTEEYRRKRGNMDAFIALTPLRRGQWGTGSLNEKISYNLGRTTAAFPGMPIVFTRNDATRQLWNGDRALVERFGDRLRAVLRLPDGDRVLPLAVLPDWEAAWVQTIHKSQGSEFDAVTVILPKQADRLLSREILYTALTRARHRVCIYSDEETLRAALQRRVIRHSRIRHWAAGE